MLTRRHYCRVIEMDDMSAGDVLMQRLWLGMAACGSIA
jgi:hypothetical protein